MVCAAEPLRPPLAVHYHTLRLPHSTAPRLRSAHEPALAREHLLSVECRHAALPHVVPQLLPHVWQHMLPLVGVFADDGRGADGAGTPAAPVAGTHDSGGGPLHNSGVTVGPRVGLVYADMGQTVVQRYMPAAASGEASGGGMPYAHLVRGHVLCTACTAHQRAPVPDSGSELTRRAL